MSEELEPLSPDMARLLDVERRRPPPSADVLADVLGRVSTSVVVRPPSAPGVAAAPANAMSSISRRVIALVGTAFVAGAGTGALVHAQLSSPRVVPVYLPAPTPSIDASAAGTSTSSSAEAAVPFVERPEVMHAPPTMPSALAQAPPQPDSARGKDVDLASERAWLEQARMALARGQSEVAMEVLERHRRDFGRGRGRLSEEREALAVQALVQAGRYADARARAAAFRAHYPSSVFLPVLDEALGTIP